MRWEGLELYGRVQGVRAGLRSGGEELTWFSGHEIQDADRDKGSDLSEQKAIKSVY